MKEDASYHISCDGFIARQKDISYPAKFIYERICSLSWSEGYCWAGNAELMEHVGWSNEKSFGNILTELEEAHYINRVYRDSKRLIYPLKLFVAKFDQVEKIPTPPNGRGNDSFIEIPTPPNGLPPPRPIDGAPPAQWATFPPHSLYKEEYKKRVKGGESARARDPLPSPPFSQDFGQEIATESKEPSRPSSSPIPPSIPTPFNFSSPAPFRDKKSILLSESQFENLIDMYTPVLGYDRSRDFVYREIEKLDKFLGDKPGAYRGKHYEKLAEWCLADLNKSQEKAPSSPQPHDPRIPPKTENNLIKKIELNKEFVKEDLSKYEVHRKFVIINSLSVSIWSPEGTKEIGFSEEGFQEQYQNSLQKSGAVSSLTPLSLPKDMGYLPKLTEQQLKAKGEIYIRKFFERHRGAAGKITLHPDGAEFTLVSGEKRKVLYAGNEAELEIVKMLEEMKKYE